MSFKIIKRLLCLALACALVFGLTAVSFSDVSAASTVLGDADGNGRLSVNDVVKLSQYVANGGTLSADCDVNADGITDTADVKHLLYHLIYGAIAYPLGTPSGENLTGWTINNVDVMKYQLVYPFFNTSYLTKIEIDALAAGINKKSGATFSVVDDKTAPATYEIIVGFTNRVGCKLVSDFDDDTYSIRIEGTKIYLEGGSAHATSVAVSEFYRLLTAGNLTYKDSLTGSYAEVVAGYDANTKATKYTYKWGDDFDTATIDSTKWRVIGGNEFAREGKNGKWSAMTDSTDYVFNRGGNFYILGHQTADTYYGGTIVTDRTMRYQYGYVEKSCIIPDGDGFWSLIWFCGETPEGGAKLDQNYYNPEIDLNESYGAAEWTEANCHAWPTSDGDKANATHSSLSYVKNSEFLNESRYYCPDNGKLSDTYHTYGLLWTKDKFDFIIDGKVFYNYTFADVDSANIGMGTKQGVANKDLLNGGKFTSKEAYDAFSDTEMHLKLSFSVGRDNQTLNPINCTEFEWTNTSRFVVDYVNLYQYDDGISVLRN